jgi:hypothetical protein
MSLFYTNIYRKVIMYTFMEMIFETNLLYDFHISKLKDLKVIYHLYSQCLTQILSETTSFTEPEGVMCSTLFYKLLIDMVYSCGK